MEFSAGGAVRVAEGPRIGGKSMDGTTQLLDSDRRYLVHPLHHPDDHRQPLVVVEGRHRVLHTRLV